MARITVHVPDELKEAIDDDRPSTTSRSEWVSDACERKLGWEEVAPDGGEE